MNRKIIKNNWLKILIMTIVRLFHNGRNVSNVWNSNMINIIFTRIIDVGIYIKNFAISSATIW